MEELRLTIPAMWADHHVLAVREALTELGIPEVEASAASKTVRLLHDPAVIAQDKILQTLAKAGFDPSARVSFPQPLANKERESAWFSAGVRTTETNRLDLEMSGDFRKY